jgi:hypothetical protein
MLHTGELIVDGPIVSTAAPWALRVFRLRATKSGGMKYTASSGTAVPPPLGEERVFRWAFICMHTWINAAKNLENIRIATTHLEDDGVNRPIGKLSRINDFIEGKGDIVAVRLVEPIKIPDGVAVPPLDWDHMPKKGDETLQYGYGPFRNSVLRFLEGRVIDTVPMKSAGSGVMVRQQIIKGITEDQGKTEGGDSGGPVHINGRIVGIHKGSPKPNPDRRSQWSPLHQEVELRQEFESRAREIKAIVAQDGRIDVRFRRGETLGPSEVANR